MVINIDDSLFYPKTFAGASNFVGDHAGGVFDYAAGSRESD